MVTRKQFTSLVLIFDTIYTERTHMIKDQRGGKSCARATRKPFIF